MVRNAAKITVANKTLCMKVLCVRLVVYAICFSICYFLAKATIFPLLQSQEVSNVLNTIREIIGKFFTSDPSTFEAAMSSVNETLTANVNSLTALFQQKVVGIVWSVVGVIIVTLILSFLLGVFDYTVGVLINEHMSSLQHASFFTTLFENFISACSYGLYRLISLLIYNLVMYSIVGAISILLLYLIDFIALPLIVFMVILVVVLRQTYAGQTLPNMVCGKMKVTKALKANFKNVKGTQVVERFISYLFLGIVTFSLTVLGAASTFYVSLIITIPFSAVIYSAVKFVDYYSRNSMRYYITYDQIVTPKELRENDEQLLNKMEL
ncbi:MAG: hypothetical protein J6R88_04715 [Clostridia bacterium]|nr:hypothetical protein [Clostridia bacterium]